MTDIPAVWPDGCRDPFSCERKRVCQYLGCHYGRGTHIGEAIDRAIQACAAERAQAIADGELLTAALKLDERDERK